MSYHRPSVYILNYITTLGGTLEVIYNLVVRKAPITLDELRRCADLRSANVGEDHVKNGVNLLHTIGLIDLGSEGYSATGPAAEGVRFQLRLIKALRKAPGRQTDFLRLHDVLVREGITSTTDDELITILNRKEFTTPGETDVNANKAGWWIRTSDYLGIIQQLHQRKRFLVMLEPELIIEMLREHAANQSEVVLADWVRYSETNYLLQMQADGTLHPGLKAVLSELASRNEIQLIIRDDSKRFQLTAGREVSHLKLVERETDNA